MPILPLLTAAVFGAAGLISSKQDGDAPATIKIVKQGRLIGEVPITHESVGAVSRAMGGRGPTAGLGIVAQGAGGGSRVAQVLSTEQLLDLGFAFEPDVAFGGKPGGQGAQGGVVKGGKGKHGGKVWGKLKQIKKKAKNKHKKTQVQNKHKKMQSQNKQGQAPWSNSQGQNNMGQGGSSKGSGNRVSFDEAIAQMKSDLQDARDSGDSETAHRLKAAISRLMSRRQQGQG